jgi:crotonobetainyl-CoA:carnitine CoA-transferase CaiB-like acyl-CoA transferase
MSDHLFNDLLVIDCASFIAGPAAGTIMSDFGARVIKIEPPGAGDGYRMLQYLPGIPNGDTNYPWTLTNRNKESLALDLKQAAGRDILDLLVARADVFITNYPLPVRERLKLGYEEISAINPRIIYGSMTPYGEQGPEANNTGYDATAWWARSGLMDSVRSSSRSQPALSVPGMGDHMAACSLYGAIVTALYRRERTGKGAKVGSSLLANGLWSNGFNVQAALDGASMKSELDSSKLSAFTQIYACSDDRWFILAILPQAQEQAWPALAQCVGHDEWLGDARFGSVDERKDNNRDLTALLREAFLEHDWDYWRTMFAEFGITCGCIAKAEDHADDEQVQAAGFLAHFENSNEARTVDSPLYVHGESKQAPRPAPGVGEHSLAILGELGIDTDTAAKLRESGVISHDAVDKPAQ